MAVNYLAKRKYHWTCNWGRGEITHLAKRSGYRARGKGTGAVLSDSAVELAAMMTWRSRRRAVRTLPVCGFVASVDESSVASPDPS